jgi:hypothetical protein
VLYFALTIPFLCDSHAYIAPTLLSLPAFYPKKSHSFSLHKPLLGVAVFSAPNFDRYWVRDDKQIYREKHFTYIGFVFTFFYIRLFFVLLFFDIKICSLF